MPVDVEKLMQDKRLVRVCLWFVVDGELERIRWGHGDMPYRIHVTASDVTATALDFPTIPEDGFLTGKGIFADGTSEYYGGDGWLVLGMTKHGLLCQTTGGDRPDPERYPGCQFSRCKLAPSAIMHVAAEEMQQWR